MRMKVNGQAAEVTADVKAYFDMHCLHYAHCNCQKNRKGKGRELPSPPLKAKPS